MVMKSHFNKVKYTFTWSIHEVKHKKMVKEYWERVLWNGGRSNPLEIGLHPRRFLEIFFALSTPHRLRINSKKRKTHCLSYFLVWKTMMVLQSDDRCHATVHKGLQILVFCKVCKVCKRFKISCTWESIQKKLVCRWISCPWSKVRSWMMFIV